jgi:uncharacterized membrane protein YphA (DoxX/SURF4 family)
MRSPALAVVGRLAVRLFPAVLLFWAGLTKAFSSQESILAVNAYDVLPEGLVRPVAAVLPWIEIGVAVLLVLGLFVRFAGIATAVLAGLFILAMAQAKARGLPIDCGCFGGGGTGDGLSWWDILRDIPILLAGIYLALRPHGPWQLDNRFLDMEDDDGEHREADEARPAARTG